MRGRKLQMLWECYQPGADTGRVVLSHEGEECGLVISGRLEVIVDGERRVLGPGDAYSFDSDRLHRFRCVGDEHVYIVSACTPDRKSVGAGKRVSVSVYLGGRHII